MSAKTNRSLQAKAIKHRRSLGPIMREHAIKQASFEYAQEHVTKPGAYPVYWIERDFDTCAKRRTRLRAHF